MANRLLETYTFFVIPHDNHIFKTVSDIAMSTMCAYPLSKFSLPHWKYDLNFCAQCTRTDLPILESDQHNFCINPTVSFHVYQQIERCTVHGRRPFNENKQFQLCENSSDSIVTTNKKQKRYCHDRDINCWLLSTILHTSNTETCITLETCISSWNT